MHPSLSPLPRPLLTHLGAGSRLDALAEWPLMAAVPADVLRRRDDAERYHVNVDGQGLSLEIQCLNPDASPPDWLWGVHSATLTAPHWRGAWPGNLDINEATQEDVVRLMAADPGEVMRMPALACFAIEGAAGQAWSAVAAFAQADRKLKSITLVRVSEWREVEPGVTVLASEPDPAREPSSTTCRSFDIVPLTGVWEGRLPPEHPQAEAFGWAPHRFVFRQSGDEMVSLGLPPFDEGMVVWTWLRSR